MIESVALGTMAKIATKEGSSASKFLPVAGASVAILGGGLKCFTTVPAGHIGMRVRWDDYKTRDGALRGLVRPGRLRFALPWSDSIHSISLQDSNMNLPNFSVKGVDDKQYAIAAQLTWGIAPERGQDGKLVAYHLPYKQIVYRAMTRAINPEERAESISGLCTETLRDIVLQEPNIQSINGKALFGKLEETVRGELLDSYGAQVRRLTIQQVAETESSMLSRSISSLGAVSIAASSHESYDSII